MIVGSKDLRALKRNINNLADYCTSLLPREVRHNGKILNNQKYLVALELRRMKDIDYSLRMKLCEELLEGVFLTGDISTIIEFHETLEFVDYNTLCYNLFKPRMENPSSEKQEE